MRWRPAPPVGAITPDAGHDHPFRHNYAIGNDHPKTDFEAAWAEGQTMLLEEVITYAIGASHCP